MFLMFCLFCLLQTFKYDRFIDAKFYKNGKELKNPVMAFGSLCPGKRYALLQLKWFILRLFTRFQLEQVEGKSAELDHNYHGHEVLPPKQDVDIRFRQISNPPTLEFLRD